jgi:hypothetical protein
MSNIANYANSFTLNPPPGSYLDTGDSSISEVSTQNVQLDIEPSLGVYNINTPDGKKAPLATWYTWANLPSPTDYIGIAFVTDIGGGSYWISNGTIWSPMGGRLSLYSLAAANPQTLGTAKIMAQNLIPAGLLKDRGRLRITLTYSKSGTVETCAHNFRLGTLGTVADTSVANTGAPGAANVAVGNILELQRISATQILRLGSAVTGGYNGPSTTAMSGPVTVPNMDQNPLFLTLSSLSSANVETYTLHDYRVEIFAS